MSKASILLVEDDENLGFVIKDNLELNQFSVELVKDGLTAKDSFFKQAFDICIFDVMLPKLDGFSLARQIREVDVNTPILFLTAKSLKEDRIKGFKLGGDDYITKPFSIEELVLRIEAVLKRLQPIKVKEEKSIEDYPIGDYLFKQKNLKLVFKEEVRDLTQREADLLHLLASNANNVIQRNEILIQLWGDDDYFKGRSLDVFISRLRKYLKNDARLHIANIHGVGFRFEIAL